MTKRLRSAWVLAAVAAAACAQGPTPPATLDTRGEACGFCRMALSEPRFAAQLVSPSEEPRFFDDVGCLRDYLAAAKSRPAHLAAYVADHRTGSWVGAARAIYAKVAGLETPMGSHLIAHADPASRDADPVASGGVALTAVDVFGTSLPREEIR